METERVRVEGQPQASLGRTIAGDFGQAGTGDFGAVYGGGIDQGGFLGDSDRDDKIRQQIRSVLEKILYNDYKQVVKIQNNSINDDNKYK
jgi:hypothetical protein